MLLLLTPLLQAARRDPRVQKSIEVDVALIDQYDALVTDLERTIVREAKRHNADAFHRLRSVPGIGKVLALTIFYEIHDITRFDRVQEFASYLLVAIVKKRLGLDLSLYKLLQILSVTLFEKTPISIAVFDICSQFDQIDDGNQLQLFDL